MDFRCIYKVKRRLKGGENRTKKHEFEHEQVEQKARKARKFKKQIKEEWEAR